MAIPIYIPTNKVADFPGGSDGKASAYSAGDPGSTSLTHSLKAGQGGAILRRDLGGFEQLVPWRVMTCPKVSQEVIIS